jgi:hypothetical protein
MLGLAVAVVGGVSVVLVITVRSAAVGHRVTWVGPSLAVGLLGVFSVALSVVFRSFRRENQRALEANSLAGMGAPTRLPVKLPRQAI